MTETRAGGARIPSLHQARQRHATHYVSVLRSLGESYAGDAAARTRAVEEFESDWGQLRTAQAWASGPSPDQAGDPDLAYLFAVNADPLVALRHPPDVMRTWYAPASTHRLALADPALLAETLNRLGANRFDAGEFAAARDHFGQALAELDWADVADRHYYDLQAAGYAANLGAAQERLGDREAAHAAYERARKTFRRLGETRHEGRMWLNLGAVRGGGAARHGA